MTGKKRKMTWIGLVLSGASSVSLILYEFSPFSQLSVPSSGLSLGNPLTLLIYLV